eukprot:sb/3471494/
MFIPLSVFYTTQPLKHPIPIRRSNSAPDAVQNNVVQGSGPPISYLRSSCSAIFREECTCHLPPSSFHHHHHSADHRDRSINSNISLSSGSVSGDSAYSSSILLPSSYWNTGAAAAARPAVRHGSVPVRTHSAHTNPTSHAAALPVPPPEHHPVATGPPPVVMRRIPPGAVPGNSCPCNNCCMN